MRGAKIARHMQALGLSDSTPCAESRWRALLWPTIRNEVDFDYVTTQGLWICFIVAAPTLALSPFSGSVFGECLKVDSTSLLALAFANEAESPQSQPFPLTF
jgi:hypothetical protein